jgi:hypothetical protein
LSPGKERGRTPAESLESRIPLEPAGAACRTPIMPSLFRFLVVVSVLGAVAYATVFALANFVSYKPREIIVTVPSDRFIKPQR